MSCTSEFWKRSTETLHAERDLWHGSSLPGRSGDPRGGWKIWRSTWRLVARHFISARLLSRFSSSSSGPTALYQGDGGRQGIKRRVTRACLSKAVRRLRNSWSAEGRDDKAGSTRRSAIRLSISMEATFLTSLWTQLIGGLKRLR